MHNYINRNPSAPSQSVTPVTTHYFQSPVVASPPPPTPVTNIHLLNEYLQLPSGIAGRFQPKAFTRTKAAADPLGAGPLARGIKTTRNPLTSSLTTGVPSPGEALVTLTPSSHPDCATDTTSHLATFFLPRGGSN
ncbi:hypothetical protein E2C01_024183 [Portunus trituberculatus]|uniref:Uncharacterized protein n=1 Tax=Portunus trituberculatus TaxID=210409 RepID=A0A5B7E9W4_PORTR|nr:hypothetical protein [Portunus trituberculatus]